MNEKQKFRHWYGEGNGNPLQCSCLENPRNGGAGWAAVYGVTQSQTRLKRLSSSSSRHWQTSSQDQGVSQKAQGEVHVPETACGYFLWIDCEYNKPSKACGHVNKMRK